MLGQFGKFEIAAKKLKTVDLLGKVLLLVLFIDDAF